MKIFPKKLIYGVWYFFAAALVLAALLVIVAHLLTPLLNRHRLDLEAWASERLQVPITIGEVHADWRGNIPELTLSRVVILDKQTHQPAFEIDELKFGFQLFSSLWQRKIIPEDIILSGAEVTVLEDNTGHLTIKDLPEEKGLQYQSYQLTKVLDVIFSHPYLSMRNVSVHVLLPHRQKYEFNIKKVSLLNQGETHKIIGNFLLKQEVPTEVDARIEWFGQVDDFAHIKAKAYLNLEGLSLGQWLQGKNRVLNGLFSGWQIHQGLGGVEFWVQWADNRLQEVQSVFQWYDLEFYSESDKKTYPIDHLGGHIGWKREGDKQIFAGDNILINFPNHLWPATTFYLTLVPNGEHAQTAGSPENQAEENKPSSSVAAAAPDAAPLKKGLALAEAGVKRSFVSNRTWRLEEARLGFLDLEDLLPIFLANSSLSPNWHKLLSERHLQGVLQNLIFFWKGDLRDFSRLRFSGEFKGLSFNAWQKWPGIMNMDGSLNWDRGEGNLKVLSRKLSLSLPTLFEGPLFLDQAQGLVDFEYSQDEGWSFQASQVNLSNADFKIDGMAQMIFPSQESPTLDLEANFSLAKVTQVSKYLPSRIMDPGLVVWLKDAFLKGRIESGKVLIQGKLDQFPFDPAEMKQEEGGKFEVTGELRNIDFHYAPEWPLLQQANGRLLFSGRSMTATIDTGSILDIPVRQVTGTIPYLGEGQAQIVNLQAKLETDLSDGMDFIHQSPLEEAFGKSLSALELTGPLKLALSLSIPVAKPENTKVLGKAEVHQATLSLPDWKLDLDQVSGNFQFTEQDLSAKALHGLFWGEPASLSFSTVTPLKGKPSYLQAVVNGNINMTKLQDTFKLSLSQFLSGSTAFRAKLKLYHSPAMNNEVYFSSNLLGIALDLPAPFGKRSEMKRELTLNFLIQEGPGFKTQLKYDDLIQAQLNIRQEQNYRIIDVDSSQVKGRVMFAYPFNSKTPIEADLVRLVINAGNAQTIASLNPASVPPLNISTQQFIYGNRNLGTLDLITIPRARGMIIQDFSLTAPDYHFQSKGQWTGSGQAQQSQLRGTIEATQVKRFMDRLGFSLRSLIVDKGKAAFDLHWKGAPYSFNLATLSGGFSFALEKGRIINLSESEKNKMDLGRMLSLFSLQTIPRRLSLDFSDLVEQGYSFDFMRGDFSLKQGSAFTQKEAVLDGPVAHVAAKGRIGLLSQDYDLILSVSPHVTESLPVVAGALTLNPFVGAAAWVVNKVVLSKEVSRVVTHDYKVTGPWSAPVWRSVSGKGS